MAEAPPSPYECRLAANGSKIYYKNNRKIAGKSVPEEFKQQFCSQATSPKAKKAHAKKSPSKKSPGKSPPRLPSGGKKRVESEEAKKMRGRKNFYKISTAALRAVIRKRFGEEESEEINTEVRNEACKIAAQYEKQGKQVARYAYLCKE